MKTFERLLGIRTKLARTISVLIVATIGLAVNGYSQSFLSSGLVAYYPFNGNANDASGYLNNPVLNTASLTSNRFNLQNTAYSFSGAQQIQYADQSQLQTTTNLTVSCWVKTTNTFGGFYGLVCKATGSNPWVGYQVGVYQDHVQVEVDLMSFAGTIPINDGQWHSICAVFDHANGRLKIFVDGNLDSAVNTPGNDLVSPFPLYIGAGRGGVSLFTGSIDDVRIYNCALSTNEVSQLYAMETLVLAPPFLHLAINLATLQQNTNNDDGEVTATAPPRRVSYGTAAILKALAFDENLAGNWPSNSFPKNAKLAIASDRFIVVSGTNVLLNVSDIMTLSFGGNEIISGRQNNVSGLASHTAQKRQMARITFNDTFIAGGRNLKFYLQGLLRESRIDTTPSGGIYKGARTVTITNAAGDGSTQDIPFVCTGTITASGMSALSL